MKIKRWFSSLLCMAVVCMLGLLSGTNVRAGTLYESSYVDFSPNGYAWTVKESLPYSYYLEYFYKENVTPEYWYPKGERIETGITTTLRELGIGEHYYAYKRKGEVPVKYWEVKHSQGGCIHDACKEDYWNGVPNVGVEGNGNPCMKGYYSGWFAYCADCEGQLTHALVYMSRNAAASITFLDMDRGYYYSCPSCAHIENTVGVSPHECRAVSFNRYRIVYDKNDDGTGTVDGLMDDSFHMYNNEDVYRGEQITPIARLSKNVYKRKGYAFTGWNTKPDGSGTSYVDCAEILNLSVYDYRQDNERGTVTLYAQWEDSWSTLKIDPNGGTYEERSGITILNQMYGDTYHADPAKVAPPLGYNVSFETNGGSPVSDRRAVSVFAGWKLSEPFYGKMWDNVYAFLGDDGAIDTLTALYEPGSIILPAPTRPGYSFGGWFEDAKYTKPVGFGGDSYTPKADTTLYAKWVELVLHSVENYVDNDRKGAVDLSWSQPDDLPKSYKLYESKDGENFSLIYGAKETTNKIETGRNFAFKGVREVYTVPYSGFYEISAAGAQGGDYGTYTGGWGGSTTARMYLTAGEQLTVTVGGKNRYNGGGEGTVYGNGGGATTIVSNLRGTLLVAGGGGGASESGHGGQGGLEASLRADGDSMGASGHAGGGAGYVGGNAGEYIVHTHTEECIVEHDLSYSFSGFEGMTFVEFNGVKGTTSGYIHLYAHTGAGNNIAEIRIGDSSNLIDVKDNTKLSIPFYFHSWGEQGIIKSNGYMAVYDQAGNRFATVDMSDRYTDTWTQDANIDHYVIDRTATPYEVELPEGTTGVYVVIWLPIHAQTGDVYGAWVQTDVHPLFFSGGIEYEYTCGLEEGEIIASKPAYGGSSYVNESCAIYYQSMPCTRSGNGEASVKAVAVGYLNSLSLSGVAAPDLAAPDKISTEEKDLTLKADGDKAVKVTFTKPKDNGTPYRYKAESYKDGTDVLLCTSNITTETLTTGVEGYYYILDTVPVRTVTADNADNKGNLLPSAGNTNTVRVILTEDVMYLHIAAVDVAGNVGPTTDIEINQEDIAWSLATDRIVVTDMINGKDYGTVYQKDDNTFYARADGQGPFMLSYQSYLGGDAREDYQIDYQIFDVVADAKHQRYSTKIPYSIPISSEASLQVSEFIREMSGDSVLKDAMNTGAYRKREAKDNYFFQAFTVPKSYHGQTLVVTPVVGSTFGEETIYSKWSDDITNAVYLIADGEAPVISGLELLENKELINRNEGSIVLNLMASDDLSGVKDFYLEIVNTDNFSSKTYYPGEDGSIRVEITKDEVIFSGDICVTAYAMDYVGNETKLTYGATEFALTAEIKRILIPHEPIFKCGESGILTITVWGYADRVEVEFPEEFTAQNPQLNQVFVYTDSPRYKQEEQLQFMVPLKVPVNKQYNITVRAYKGDKKLEEYPSLSTVSVGGSVLDELRTRLK